MKKARLPIVAIALATITSSQAYAGGLAEPVMEVAPVATPEVIRSQSPISLSGAVGLRYGQTSFEQTDDDVEDDGLSGFSFKGHVRADWNAWSAFADLNSVTRDIGNEDFDDFLPEGATAYGLHVGRNFGPLYFGGFYGQNRFQGSDASSDNGYVSGDLYGLEAEYQFARTGALFGQYGVAEMVGDEGDTAFDGNFHRLGASYGFGRFGVVADYEKGRSDDIFEDSGDWGEYEAYGIEASYQFSPSLIATIGYETTTFTANTEDEGTENTISVGLTVPFGAAGSRNNLTTTYRPGLAAAWAETLD